MVKATYLFASIVTLGIVTAACTAQPSKDEARVAELEKQLAATKQELAAKSAEPAAPTAAPQAAPSAAPQTAPPSDNREAAANREAVERAARAVEQAKGDRAATERALAEQEKALNEQKAASARQADETARLRRELDAMKPREFTLPAGTMIAVRTTAELSTKSVKNGSVFEGLLERDIVIDGTTLAKAGTHVGCVVVSSDPGGRIKGVASMSVAARSIAGVGGNTLAVKTEPYDVDSDTTKGKDAKRTGIAAGAGAVIGAIAGGAKGAAIGLGAGAAAGVGVNAATRGDAAVIPAETLIEFKLSAPATVVFRK